MQKKIIALAVAALASTAAFAQTNVTIYGVFDVQQAFVKSSGANFGENQPSVGRLDAHGNYIGFKGVEDLGNGLKAVFVYETAFNTDNNSGLYGGRDAYVGLAGGFGTVAMGQLTHPLRAFGAKVDLMPGAAGFGTTASLTGTVGGIKTGADDRAQNAIAYISPSFGGFTVIGAYVNGENKTNESVNRRSWQLAAQYDNGPLFVGAGYHRVVDDSVALTGAAPVGGAWAVDADGKASVMRLAAVYTLPSATKLTALVDRTKATTNLDLDAKRTAFSLGVSQGFGKNTVGLQYAQTGSIKLDGDALDGTKAKMWTAMYGYELSKRTMLHARYSHLANKENVNNNFYNMSVGNTETSTGGANYSGFSVGVRHTF